MSWASVIMARLRGLIRHGQLEHDLDEELRFHLDMQAEDNRNAGMSPQQARYAALRSFGAMEAMKEEYRERMSCAPLETIVQDLRYALRTLRKSPGFTAAAVTTLALAIGANTAMFSVVNAVLLRPLPYQAPERLAMLWTESPSENLREGRSGYWNVEAWRQSKSFADMAAFDGVAVTLTTADKAERITVARITPNFLPLLGIQPAEGRLFSAAEAEQRQRVALISHAFWHTHFAGSPEAIGTVIELDGLSSRIIGVLPAGFHFPKLAAEVWEPHTLFPDWPARRAVRGVDTWSVVARLQPNVSFEQAQAEMTALAHSLDEHMPAAERNRGITVVPLSLHVVGARSRLALWLLAAAVGCVLLIAASNVASLSLARGISRARELAIRAALGATSFRIMRQLIAEGITLAVMAGAAGSLLALTLISLIRSLDPAALGLPPRLGDIALDGRVLTAALALSLVTGLLVGLAPATTIRRRSLSAEGGRTLSGGATAQKLRQALVVAEFALAIVLLFAAGLLVRSWQHVENVDTGFRPNRVLTMQLRTPVRMPPSQRAHFYTQLLQEVAAVPGVESAGFTSDLFITSTREQILTAEGDVRDIPERLQLRRDEVSPDFFQTVGTPLHAGRFFSDGDGPDAPRVAIINHTLARRLWPKGDPVGRRFKFGPAHSNGVWFTVVGVVADMRRQGVEREPVPQLFESIAQNPSGSGSLVVRTSMNDPLTMAPAIQAAVRRIEKHAPLYGAETLESQLVAFLLPRRFQTFLVVAFSAIALLLAAVGIYGLVQYSVATRTKEIGIRMAVGAQGSSIFRMILSEGLRLSLTGLALGLTGAVAVGRLSSSLLFGVTATDPVTLMAAPLVLTALSAAACYLPARRAMRVEPVITLRDQ